MISSIGTWRRVPWFGKSSIPVEQARSCPERKVRVWAYPGLAGLFVLPLEGKERAVRKIQPGAVYPRFFGWSSLRPAAHSVPASGGGVLFRRHARRAANPDASSTGRGEGRQRTDGAHQLARGVEMSPSARGLPAEIKAGPAP